MHVSIVYSPTEIVRNSDKLFCQTAGHVRNCGWKSAHKDYFATGKAISDWRSALIKSYCDLERLRVQVIPFTLIQTAILQWILNRFIKSECMWYKLANIEGKDKRNTKLRLEPWSANPALTLCNTCSNNMKVKVLGIAFHGEVVL